MEAKRSSRGTRGAAAGATGYFKIDDREARRARHKSPTLDTYTRLAMDLDEDILGTARMPGGREAIAHRHGASPGTT